jgi:general stress protein 26
VEAILHKYSAFDETVKIHLGKKSSKVSVKVKAKVSVCSEHRAMKAYWGSGCIAPLIL